LEALACQKPVVTTSIGAEGLHVSDGNELIISDDKEEMAQAIIKLFNTRDVSVHLGMNGREFVLKYHDWNVVLSKIDKWLLNFS